MMSSVCSSRFMPRNPTSAVGRRRVMPSSMPRPARKTGTTIGRGRFKCLPVILQIGVSISRSLTSKLRVASYASRVTNSETNSRKMLEGVFLSRKTVSLWSTSGWCKTWRSILSRLVQALHVKLAACRYFCVKYKQMWVKIYIFYLNLDSKNLKYKT